MPTYATLAQFRAERPSLTAAVIDDPTVTALLAQAERDVDELLVGYASLNPTTGLRLDVTRLAGYEATALMRAVVAQADYLRQRPDVAAGLARAVTAESGPDYSVTYATAADGSASSQRWSPLLQRELAPIRHLRAPRGARARP